MYEIVSESDTGEVIKKGLCRNDFNRYSDSPMKLCIYLDNSKDIIITVYNLRLWGWMWRFNIFVFQNNQG